MSDVDEDLASDAVLNGLVRGARLGQREPMQRVTTTLAEVTSRTLSMRSVPEDN